jgi:molybdopterin-containing oxidoreductase family iron-sulfur binding subunit
MTIPAEPKSGVKRREFLKVLGVTGAATTMVGCSSDQVEKLIPYVTSPDHTVPGVSNYYASTCRECAAGCGIIVETRDGRAIKIEGNPDHPVNRGALCARGQAALQGLYNPDRFRGPMMRQNGQLVPITWDQAIDALHKGVDTAMKSGKAKNAVFINQHEQGLLHTFLDAWLALRGMPAHISYDAEAPFATVAANRAVYGVSWPRLDFGAAKVIVSFAADFLDGWGLPVPQQLDFSEARGRIEGAPRLIYIGPRRPLTGLNADQWIPAKPGTAGSIAKMLAGKVSAADAAAATDIPVAILEGLQKEVASAKPSLLLAGGTGPRALDMATEVNQLNRALGNVGVTIKPAESYGAWEGVVPPAVLNDVVAAMEAGDVPALFIRGANPVYSTPTGLGFAKAAEKVPFKVSFSAIPDETTALCDLILPDHHALESWGIAEPVQGTLGLQQPAMDPVFNTRSTADVLLASLKPAPCFACPENPAEDKQHAADASKFPPDYRGVVARHIGGNGTLQSALPTGMLAGSLPKRTAPVAKVMKPAIVGEQNGEYYLATYWNLLMGDGRGANKPWLQELPDPVTKICWQTVVEMHPETAKKLGVEAGDHVTVKTVAGTVTAPAFLYIGVRPDTIAVMVGRGQTAAGRYATGTGHNAWSLLPASNDQAGGYQLVGVRCSVTKAEGHSMIVTTEGSGRQHGRKIARAQTLEQLLAGETDHPHIFPGQASTEFLPGLRAPAANDAQGELGDPTSAQKGEYDPNHPSGRAKRRWAMTIDLAKCTGCSACVTACYAENNIPTVGAEWQGPQLYPDRKFPGANITRSREMAWLRLERYYEMDREYKDATWDPAHHPEARVIPMMCQHCGNAPCEPVCPVYATYHAPDGLNVQVYNRCVGTRYCSNNCPYKVRYYNWFGYGEVDRAQYAFPEPLHWQLNPDVTVRAKGIMEKCSFCVQRIRDAETLAKVQNREIQGDEFTTACAQACPSRAIIFGDAADENWSVTKLIEDRRAYHVFEELNTFTAVVYLKKINHPAPAGATA